MPRKTKPLTDAAIKAAKPREKSYGPRDGQGLYLDVMPTSTKAWRLKFTHLGKEDRMTLGE